MLDAALSAGRETEQVAAADAAGIGTERKRLDDVSAAPDTAIANDFQLVAQRICNRGDTVNRGRRRLELAAAMVGDHYRCCP